MDIEKIEDAAFRLYKRMKQGEYHVREAARLRDLVHRDNGELTKRIQHIVSLGHDLTGRPNTPDDSLLVYLGWEFVGKGSAIQVQFGYDYSDGALGCRGRNCSTVTFPSWYLGAQDDVWMKDLIALRQTIGDKKQLKASLAAGLADAAAGRTKSRLVLPSSVRLAGLKG